MNEMQPKQPQEAAGSVTPALEGAPRTISHNRTRVIKPAKPPVEEEQP